LEGFFGFVDQRRDVNGLCDPVSMGPVEPLHVLRGYCAVARLAGAHTKLLVVDDFSSAYVGRSLLGSTLLIALHPVAEHAQRLALFDEFPLEGFRAAVPRPPMVVATYVNFLATSAMIGLDVPVRTAVSAFFVLLPLEPDLSALSCCGVGIPFRPMVGIPAREAPSRQLDPTDVHGLELFFWLNA